MEYDDRYTPLESNDYDGPDFKQDSALKKTRVLSRGYHKISRNVLFSNNKNTKKVEIGVYGSGSHESPIRNAETGEYYNYTVGSKYEKMFFSVRLSTGECNGKYKLPTLFFLSPQHYEKYLHIKVNEDVIYKWNFDKVSVVNEIKQRKTINNVLVR